MMLIAVIAVAQIYKWVDDKGQVHFGDQPPQDKTTEEMDLPEGPSEQDIKKAKEEFRKTLDSRQTLDESAQEDTSSREKARELRRAQREEGFNICVRAIQQSEILKLQARIFRLNSDWSRTYLKNEDRPAEAIRVDEQVKEYCKNDPESETKQYSDALFLSTALNIKCVNPREKLISEKDPAKREEIQDYLDSNCPDIDPRGFWIADWIHR
jgi:hypothetical protein